MYCVNRTVRSLYYSYLYIYIAVVGLILDRCNKFFLSNASQIVENLPTKKMIITKKSVADVHKGKHIKMDAEMSNSTDRDYVTCHC